jgi:hypothetical protein
MGRQVTWYYHGRKASRKRILWATLLERLRGPLPFLVGMVGIATVTALARLSVGSLDEGFAFILGGVLVAYIGLSVCALAALRMIEAS